MFDHLLESSHQDNSNKWSIIGFSEEIMQVVSIEVNSYFFLQKKNQMQKFIISIQNGVGVQFDCQTIWISDEAQHFMGPHLNPKYEA